MKNTDLFNQLKSLKQYSNYTDDQLWAEVGIRSKIEEMALRTLFKKDEYKNAKDLAYKYLSKSALEHISELNDLRNLIYYEVIQFRLQDKMNDIYKSDNAVPSALISTMHENSAVITNYKIKLGLIAEDKKEETPYDAFKHYRERVKKWAEENQASRTIRCAYCSKMLLLKIRPDVWEKEASKHPHFFDNVLFNKHLLYLHLKGIITKEDIGLILNCSPDYTDWLLQKYGTNPAFYEVKKEIESGQKEGL
jgi:DNA-directed RNA polymerase subunit RPC12/RpoP